MHINRGIQTYTNTLDPLLLYLSILKIHVKRCCASSFVTSEPNGVGGIVQSAHVTFLHFVCSWNGSSRASALAPSLFLLRCVPTKTRIFLVITLTIEKSICFCSICICYLHQVRNIERAREHTNAHHEDLVVMRTCKRQQ